ncbi:coiled-coil domain-containing protein SCD2-like [Panicum miliaceum]|uniref:Coiled-coil domain-containing protein SCD2-like n=1 Tax=Panicum miliaceum TaxID=4540 RepID=A0A3L6RD08_PANMI|nr:coiled-coil domain-containing protein SCD2-like [Panicum miliaceum]
MDRLSRPASPGGGGLGYASRRGLYARPASPAAGGSAQTSPGGSPKESSPVHRHARAGSLGGVGAASTAGRRAGVGAGARAQNSAARAAAQRLARVMGGDGGSGSDDDDDYELSGPPIELSATPRRTSTRSPSPSIGRYLADQTQVGRPPSLTNRYTAGKSVPMIPSIKRPGAGAGTGPGSESPMPNRREQRRSVDLGSSMRGRRTSSSLHDEINTLQVENESVYDKLHLAEERSEDGDAKSMHMEREASDIDDAVETETIVISRKDAALEQRKIAMRIASRRSSSASCDEIATLKSEAKAANNVVTSVSRRVKGARSELRSLQATANRMILSQEDMVEDAIMLALAENRHIKPLSVERGFHELRKLGIESKLWDASRRALNDDLSNHGSPTVSEA